MNPKVEKTMLSSLTSQARNHVFVCSPTNKSFFHLRGTFQTKSTGKTCLSLYVAIFCGTTAHCGREPGIPGYAHQHPPCCIVQAYVKRPWVFSNATYGNQASSRMVVTASVGGSWVSCHIAVRIPNVDH